MTKRKRRVEPENLLRGVKNPPSPTYNADFYETGFMKWVLKMNRKLLDYYDARLDQKICGRSLTRYVPSVDREGKGATGTKSSRYLFLDRVFEGWKLSPEEKVFDVGCGKGRVFAYLLSKGFTGEMYGVELNPQVVTTAQSWSDKYPNVNIACADAFTVNYNDYDVLLLGKPFEKEAFVQFTEYLERTLTIPMKVYYWGDHHSGDYLNRRPGWELQYRNWVFRHNGIHIATSPQRYSIWIYTP